MSVSALLAAELTKKNRYQEWLVKKSIDSKYRWNVDVVKKTWYVLLHRQKQWVLLLSRNTKMQINLSLFLLFQLASSGRGNHGVSGRRRSRPLHF